MRRVITSNFTVCHNHKFRFSIIGLAASNLEYMDAESEITDENTPVVPMVGCIWPLLTIFLKGGIFNSIISDL